MTNSIYSENNRWPENWLGKPYYSLDAYCKQTFGRKVYKVSLNIGLSCPNRDGSLDTRGCIFCSEGGSGDFAYKIASPETGIFRDAGELLKKAFSAHPGSPFIGYFQAYTNTYGPLSYLKMLYEYILARPEIIGISIATRPDCISHEIIRLLSKLKIDFPGKFIWVELGLQTIHERTAAYIRRGYSLPCFQRSYEHLTAFDIPVVIHVILGLPNESTQDMVETICYVNHLHPFGVKLQLLHILEGTDLAGDYLQGKFKALSREEYISLAAKSLSLLSSDIVIHRITGDGPKRITLAPKWSFDKKNVLNTLHGYMREKGIYHGSGTSDTL